MGAYTGNYSRNMFDIKQHYVQLRQQVAKPLIDADENDGNQIFYEAVKRAIQGVAGDGSPNNGFKVSQLSVPVDNDFLIGTGDGTGLNLGLFFLRGNSCYLLGHAVQPLTYMRDISGTVGEEFLDSDTNSINSKITAVSYNSGTNETTITDSAANYFGNLVTTGELIGRKIKMDISNATASITILKNDATNIVVSGDQTAIATVNSRYRIDLLAPTVARRDGVYLDVYLDEIDATEDGNLNHNITTPTIQTLEAQRRIRLEQSIFVREDLDNADGRGEYTSFVDGNGNQHIVFKIAEINRTAGPWEITDAVISDLRPNIVPGGASDLPGTMKIWPVLSPPTGWLVADGSSHPVANFPNLFAVIGYSFGGSGANFNLPDASGRTIFGYKSGDPTFGTNGNLLGSTTKNLQHTHTNTSATSAEPDHNHDYFPTDPNGATIAAPNNTGQGQFQGTPLGFDARFETGKTNGHSHPIKPSGTHSHTLSPTDSAGSANQDVLNPGIVLPYIIKF